MSNELADLIDEIQFRTKLSLEEIADKIGYSRPYLNKAKLNGGNKKLIGILKDEYSSILQKNTKDKKITIVTDEATMVKEILQLKAIVRTLRHHVAKLDSKVNSRSLEESSEELDQNTILNLKDLINEK